MSLYDNKLIADRTEAINKIPAKPGLIGSLGFFKTRNVNKDTITFDVKGNSLKVLNDKVRSTADKNTVDGEGFDQHVIKLPHFPVESTISREDLAGVRDFNSDFEKTLAGALAEHLGDHSEMIDYHHEYQQATMLFNASFSTTYHGNYNMATELGVAQGTYNFVHAASGDTLKAFRELQNQSKAGLISGQARGFYLLAGDELFEWLLANDDVNSVFQMNQYAGPNPLMNELGEVAAGYSSFVLGSTTVVNYNDSFTKYDGTQDQVLASTAGLMVPRAQVGKMFYGPENTLAGLNSGGQRAFSRTQRDSMDRFVNVYSETNSVPLLESVGATVKVTFTP